MSVAIEFVNIITSVKKYPREYSRQKNIRGLFQVATFRSIYLITAANKTNKIDLCIDCP